MSLFLIPRYVSTVDARLEDPAMYYYSLLLIDVEKPTGLLGLERKTGWASLACSMAVIIGFITLFMVPLPSQRIR